MNHMRLKPNKLKNRLELNFDERAFIKIHSWVL